MADQPTSDRTGPTARSDAASGQRSDDWARSISTAIGGRDRTALAELYEARYDLLVRAIVLRTRRGEEFACDCAHDAWLRIARAMPTFDSCQRLDAWLVRVALTSALDRLKSERARARREADRPDPQPSQRRNGERDGPLADLAQEIERLAAIDRQALDLRFGRGHAMRIVAEALGLDVRAAESRLRRVIGRLRKRATETSDD